MKPSVIRMTDICVAPNKGLRAWMLMIVAIIAALPLCSCETDDDYYYSVEGTWVQVAPAVGGYAEYAFYDDGSGYYYIDDYQGEDEYWFDWWVSGSDLYIDYGGGEMYRFYWSLNGYDLYLYPDNGSDPLVLRVV